MQRVTSASSLHKASAPSGAGGGQGAPADQAVGRVNPDKCPVVEVAVVGDRSALAMHTSSDTSSGLNSLIPRGKGSYTSLTLPDDSAGKFKASRRKAPDWLCELLRIAIFVVVFSLMAWVTYLFLTKDE